MVLLGIEENVMVSLRKQRDRGRDRMKIDQCGDITPRVTAIRGSVCKEKKLLCNDGRQVQKGPRRSKIEKTQSGATVLPLNAWLLFQ